MHRFIDWNELWKAIHIRSPEHIEKIRDPAAHWDRRATYRRATAARSARRNRNLRSWISRPASRARVGAGTGRLAVPIAGPPTTSRPSIRLEACSPPP